MTGAALALDQLLADCEAQDVRLFLAGDDSLTIDAPDNALTPELLERLKTHKSALLDRLHTLVECETITEFASYPLGPDGWPVDCIDPDELTPCPQCGMLDLWQAAAGDLFGRTLG